MHKWQLYDVYLSWLEKSSSTLSSSQLSSHTCISSWTSSAPVHSWIKKKNGIDYFNQSIKTFIRASSLIAGYMCPPNRGDQFIIWSLYQLWSHVAVECRGNEKSQLPRARCRQTRRNLWNVKKTRQRECSFFATDWNCVASNMANWIKRSVGPTCFKSSATETVMEKQWSLKTPYVTWARFSAVPSTGNSSNSSSSSNKPNSGFFGAAILKRENLAMSFSASGLTYRSSQAPSVQASWWRAQTNSKFYQK